MPSLRNKKVKQLIAVAISIAGTAATGAEITFRNFSGVCHGRLGNELLWSEALGWTRDDFSWQKLMPRQDQWDEKVFAEYGRMILAAKARGVTVLPIIDYSTDWAGEKPDQTVEQGNMKIEYRKLPDNDKYEVTRYIRISHNGTPGWQQIGKNILTGSHIRKRWLAVDRQQDWEKFVRRLVSRLRQEPYNLEYFQIWNEPWPTSGFWAGDMDTFMTRIHLPASKIIRELGGKVVFGGWICGAPISKLPAYFDRHQAWNSVDVFDLHYFPIAGQEYLYRELEKRQLTKGIWQAEIGFGSDPNLIGNLYPRLLHWSLTRNWKTPDQYKYFYFCYQSPDKPGAYGYRRTLISGKTLSDKGKSLKVMADLFSGGTISLYNDVTSVPTLRPEIDEQRSSMECFQVGEKIICAIHLLENNNAKIFVDWNGTGDTIHLDHDEPTIRLDFAAIKAAQVERVERVGIFGSRVELTSVLESKGNGCRLQVPVREPERQHFRYTDMAETALPQVFYLLLTLK